MLHDHERLERLLRLLLMRARQGDARDLVEPWRAFEEGLRDHLAAEEEEIFPRYGELCPDDVRTLRREHAEIRALLDTAGFGVELHTTRLLMLEDLASRLREHAERENHGLYDYLERAPAPLWARIQARLAAAVHHAGAARV